MKKFFSLISLAIALTFAFTSCNEGEDTPNQVIFQSFVTYLGDATGQSGFGFRPTTDADEISIYSRILFADPKPEVDSRIVIAFTTPDNQVPTDGSYIDLLAASSACNAYPVITSRPDTLTFPQTNQMTMTAIARSGKWIDLLANVMLRPNETPKFKFYLDSASVADNTPVAYVTIENAIASDSQMTPSYASFNIASVWDNPQVDRVRVCFSLYGLGLPDYTFKKGN